MNLIKSNLYNICILKLILLYMFLPIASFSADQQNILHSHDGRMGSTCWFQVSNQAVCRIAFQQVLANPESFNNKMIEVAGYLDVDDGELALYPDKNDFLYGINEASIKFDIPYDEAKQIAKRWKSTLVRISGMFKSAVFTPDSPRAGVISSVIEVRKLELKIRSKEENEIMLHTNSSK